MSENGIFRTPLTSSELTEAMKSCVKSYPSTVKSEFDEFIPGQSFGLMSFELFNEPKKLSSGKNVYGICKTRGNFPTRSSAEEKAAEIIKMQDSKHVNLIVEVGKWVIITDDMNAANDKIDVKTDNSMQLRDQVAREKQQEVKQQVNELRERIDTLKNEVEEDRDIDANTSSLDYYVKQRWVEIQVSILLKEKERQYLEWKNKVEDVRHKLVALRKENSQYEEMWLDRMNEKRQETGVPLLILDDIHEKELREWFETH